MQSSTYGIIVYINHNDFINIFLLLGDAKIWPKNSLWKCPIYFTIDLQHKMNINYLITLCQLNYTIFFNLSYLVVVYFWYWSDWHYHCCLFLQHPNLCINKYNHLFIYYEYLPATFSTIVIPYTIYRCIWLLKPPSLYNNFCICVYIFMSNYMKKALPDISNRYNHLLIIPLSECIIWSFRGYHV